MDPKELTQTPPSNRAIAEQLERVAELLEVQAANPYRVRAYRQAAATVLALPQAIPDLLQAEGVNGLRDLSAIGASLADAIAQISATGTLPLLERLRGETDAPQIFDTVAGIGPTLANRIYEELGIESLVELETAAYDGRLAHIPGFGRDRLRAVRDSLAGRLHWHNALPRVPQPAGDRAPIGALLDIDAEYRRKASAKTLPHIAPVRFNPTGAAWLPVLHTEREGAHYTALFSNTARAHELGTIHDWVVIYRDDRSGTGQWTVVTEQQGPLKGKRVVRGRETESRAYYEHGMGAG